MSRIFIFLFFISMSINLRGSMLSDSSAWGVVAVWTYRASPLKYVKQWRPELWRSLYATQLDSMKSCGLVWNRPNLAPYNVQYGTSRFKDEGMDSLVVFMQERGLNLMVCMDPPFWQPWRNDTLKWQEFWVHTIERYDGDGNNDMPGLTKPIKHWEICNEPEYGGRGSIAKFCDYVRLSNQAIKLADPSAKVIGPSMGGNGGDFGWRVNRDSIMPGEDSTLLRMVLQGCGQYFDIISIHHYSYGDFNYLDTKIKPVLDAYAPGKELWITEAGCNRTRSAINLPDSSILCSDTVTEAKQVEYLVKLCKAAVDRSWLNKIFIFALQDFWYHKYEDSLHTGTDYWGILKEDYTHKPSFDSVKNFILLNSKKEK